MRRLLLLLVCGFAVTMGSLFTAAEADARRVGRIYYGPRAYYGGYYAPPRAYYRGYYAPRYYNYGPRYYGRSYYYPGYYGSGFRYYGPGVGISIGF
jgi:hypothetical protein